MARIKNWRLTPRPRWVAQHYRDHANQPAIFMTFKATNLEASVDPLPQIAIQVYSTVPLSMNSEDESEDDATSVCQYLSSEIFDYPLKTLSFEIYVPQPDAFACVEHQRREILHRKHHRPGEDFFPGIAKVAPNRNNQLLQGFLLVMTSYSFRAKWRRPKYEAESGLLWVNFNRSFPLRSKVDLPSRIAYTNRKEVDTSIISVDCQVYSEREEIVVKKCRNIYHDCLELSFLVSRSHCEVEGYEFDYGLNEDEGDPFLSEQPLLLELIESLHSKADSLDHNAFDIRSSSEGTVAITSNLPAATSETDLQYTIHIPFPYEQLGLDIVVIAEAFTAAIMDSLPREKTVNFEFFSASPSLAAILASHRNLINSRPERAIVGALHQGKRSFPQERHESETEIPLYREPYRTFFVVLDRPDFLTGPGVLFFLTDGNEVTDEAMQSNFCMPKDERSGYAVYQVWRSAGMIEAAGRLAMMPTNLTSWVQEEVA